MGVQGIVRNVGLQSAVVLLSIYLVLRLVLHIGVDQIGVIAGVCSGLFYVLRIDRHLRTWEYIFRLFLFIVAGMAIRGADKAIFGIQHLQYTFCCT